MSASILFLDLDGVCNDGAFVGRVLSGSPVVAWDPDLAARTLDPARVARVQTICDATGARIALVTGWRRWATIPAIIACLRAAGLTAEVLDEDVGGVHMSGDTRGSALLDWLVEHPEVTCWCVLDDTSRFYDARHEGRRVHPRDGVEDEHVEAAVAILRGGPDAAP